jgi:hypothetical protein
MRIEELKNQYVKISDRSITCKDENGKTKGIVTNAVKFGKLQPNKQIDYFKQIRAAGLWGNGESEKVYIIDGKIYYLFNLKPLEFYEKYFAGKPGFESETERYNQRKKMAEEAAKIGTVIPCYIL